MLTFYLDIVLTDEMRKNLSENGIDVDRLQEVLSSPDIRAKLDEITADEEVTEFINDLLDELDQRYLYVILLVYMPNMPTPFQLFKECIYNISSAVSNFIFTKAVDNAMEGIYDTHACIKDLTPDIFMDLAAMVWAEYDEYLKTQNYIAEHAVEWYSTETTTLPS